MNDRTLALRLTAIILAAYGIYIASHVLAMLPGPSSALLLVGFILQAVCALAAAIGVWRGDRWAGNAVVLLGVVVAVTWLVEAFVIGIVAYLYALLVAVVAIITAVLVARYIDRRGGMRIA
jgi:hypothetical protein